MEQAQEAAAEAKAQGDASEDSGSKTREASLSWNFSREARSSSYWSVSTGYIPAKSIGLTSSKPAMASEQGQSLSVMVSPTFTSAAVFIPEII